MTSARAFRISGTGVMSGYGAISFDLDVVRHVGFQGTYRLGATQLRVVDLHRKLYFKLLIPGQTRFLGAQIPKSLSTRWIEVRSSRLAAQASRLINLPGVVVGTDQALDLGSTTVAGVRARRFADPLRAIQLTVATDATPFPVTIAESQDHLTGTLSHWNERVRLTTPPDPVTEAQATASTKVHQVTLAGGSVLPGTPRKGLHTFRATGYGIEFDYPETLIVASGGPERLAGSNPHASHVDLALNEFSAIGVSRFPGLPIPVTNGDIHLVYQTFSRLISQLAGHPVAVQFTSIHRIPVLRFAPFSQTLQGVRITEQIDNAFVGTDEYELRCQYTGADAQTLRHACTTVLATLRLVNASG